MLVDKGKINALQNRTRTVTSFATYGTMKVIVRCYNENRFIAIYSPAKSGKILLATCMTTPTYVIQKFLSII